MLKSKKSFNSEHNLIIKFKDGRKIKVLVKDVQTLLCYIDSSESGSGPFPLDEYLYHVTYTNGAGERVTEDLTFHKSERKKINFAYGTNLKVAYDYQGHPEYTVGVQLGSNPIIWGQSTVTTENLYDSGGAICFYLKTGDTKITVKKTAINPIDDNKDYKFKVTRHIYNYKYETEEFTLKNGESKDISYAYVSPEAGYGSGNLVTVEEVDVPDFCKTTYKWNDEDAVSGAYVQKSINKNTGNIMIEFINSFEIPKHKVTYNVSPDTKWGIPVGGEAPVDENSPYVHNSLVKVKANLSSKQNCAKNPKTGDNVPGTWVFTAWDKKNFNITKDTVINGKWTFNPNTYKVDYEWTGDVPPAVILPTDGSAYEWHAKPTADGKYTSSTSIKGEKAGAPGTYTFSGWDASGDPDLKAEGMEGNVTFKGEWTFTPDSVSPDEPQEPNKPDKPDKPNEQDEIHSNDSPRTGDSTNIILYVVLLILSSGGLAVISLPKLKRRGR